VLGRAGNDLAFADVKLDHGDVLSLGSQRFEARRTPGHTEGCVTYVWSEEGEPAPLAAFTGDALLYRACGRTDFQGGSAHALYDSVWGHILSLPENTPLLAAHDYKGFTSSTVEEEKKFNPRLTKTQSEFVHVMDALGLAPPKKLDLAVPANRRDGMPDKAPGQPSNVEASAALNTIP